MGLVAFATTYRDLMIQESFFHGGVYFISLTVHLISLLAISPDFSFFILLLLLTFVVMMITITPIKRIGNKLPNTSRSPFVFIDLGKGYKKYFISLILLKIL
jgi:hypothetical protein